MPTRPVFIPAETPEQKRLKRLVIRREEKVQETQPQPPPQEQPRRQPRHQIRMVRDGQPSEAEANRLRGQFPGQVSEQRRTPQPAVPSVAAFSFPRQGFQRQPTSAPTPTFLIQPGEVGQPGDGQPASQKEINRLQLNARGLTNSQLESLVGQWIEERPQDITDQLRQDARSWVEAGVRDERGNPITEETFVRHEIAEWGLINKFGVPGEQVHGLVSRLYPGGRDTQGEPEPTIPSVAAFSFPRAGFEPQEPAPGTPTIGGKLANALGAIDRFYEGLGALVTSSGEGQRIAQEIQNAALTGDIEAVRRASERVKDLPASLEEAKRQYREADIPEIVRIIIETIPELGVSLVLPASATMRASLLASAHRATNPASRIALTTLGQGLLPLAVTENAIAAAIGLPLRLAVKSARLAAQQLVKAPGQALPEAGLRLVGARGVAGAQEFDFTTVGGTQKAIQALRRSRTQAKDAGVTESTLKALDDEITSMEEYREALRAGEQEAISPELAGLEEKLAETQIELRVLREPTGGRAPKFGTEARTEFDRIRIEERARGVSRKTKKQLTQEKQVELRTIEGQIESLRASAAAAREAQPQVGAIQAGMGIGERPSQGTLLEGFRGETTGVPLIDAERLQAQAARRAEIAAGQADFFDAALFSRYRQEVPKAAALVEDLLRQGQVDDAIRLLRRHGYEPQSTAVRRLTEFFSKPAAPAPAAARAAAKEPWQMTRAEYVKNFPSSGQEANVMKDAAFAQLRSALRSLEEAKASGKPRVIASAERFVARSEKTANDTLAGKFNEDAIVASQIRAASTHQRLVESALSEGKPVPANVLADYPDLAALGAPPTEAVAPRVPEAAAPRVAEGIRMKVPIEELQAADRRLLEQGLIDPSNIPLLERQIAARERLIAGAPEAAAPRAAEAGAGVAEVGGGAPLRPAVEQTIRINDAPSGAVPRPQDVRTPGEGEQILRRALYDSVRGSPSDAAATRYLRTGDFGGFIDDIPPEIPVAQRFMDGSYTEVSSTAGRLQDPTRLLQNIDNGMFNGNMQKYVLWPTRRLYMAGLKWGDNERAVLQTLGKKQQLLGTPRAKRMREAAGDVIEFIGREDVGLSVAELRQRPSIKGYLTRFSSAERERIVGYARDMRVVFDRWLDAQNAARAKRGMPEIPPRENYRPWIRDTNIWSRFGHRKTPPLDIMEHPPLPDYIFPKKPFNPREMAREGGLKDYPKIRDIDRLAKDYIDTATKDIFNTEVIRNAKPYTAELRAKGLPTSARAVDEWISEAFAGTQTPFTKFVRGIVPRKGADAMLSIRRQLTRAVFPLNFTWNLFVQTSSMVPTVARYGPLNTLRGLDYVLFPTVRRQVRTTNYSSVIKSRRGGRMAAQDVNVSVRLERSVLDTVEDVLNFLTTAIEDNLTGISVRAAHRRGQQMGLKGRPLTEFASEGGSKTQSMYNLQDLPGALRSRELGAIAPFQTFAFEMLNNLRELNIPLVRKVVGRAGAFETTTAATAAGKALASERMKQVLIWVAGMTAVNMAVDRAIDRKPWVLGSFIPFYGLLTGAMNPGSPLGDPVPIRYIGDFWDGIRRAYTHNDFRKLRQFLLRYHLVAGIQTNRTISGLEAVAKGKQTDIAGRTMFEVGSDEWLTAMLGGPYMTKGGREYLKELRGGVLEEIMGFPIPQRSLEAQLGWATEIDVYRDIPTDRFELDPGQPTRSQYRERLPDIDAKLFITGNVTSLRTPQAAISAANLIRQIGIDPGRIKALADRKEEQKDPRRAPFDTPLDLLLQMLEQEPTQPSQPAQRQPAQPARQPTRKLQMVR